MNQIITPRDFAAIRGRLGLDVFSAAQLCRITRSQVERMEAGTYSWVYREHFDVMKALETAMEGMRETLFNKPQPRILIDYAKQNHFDELEPEMAKALIFRGVYNRLIFELQADYAVHDIHLNIVTMSPDAYTEWLGDNQDSPEMRETWALERVQRYQVLPGRIKGGDDVAAE